MHRKNTKISMYSKYVSAKIVNKVLDIFNCIPYIQTFKYKHETT